ncbi:MAG TPA: hypothetical protein VF810_04260 [Patescibacteria group bacterium]
MPKSPFDLDEGFEMPAISKPTQAVKQVTGTVVKQTAKQAQQAAQSFVNQLYGATDTQAAGDQKTDTAAPLAGIQKPPTSSQVQQSASGSPLSTAAPEEQAKIEKTRRELQQTHTGSYVVPTLGKIGDLEADIRKEEEKRKQEEQKKKQEEAEEEQQKLQEKQQREQEFIMPSGKMAGGRNRMKQPISVTRAKTKAEINRGASG